MEELKAMSYAFKAHSDCNHTYDGKPYSIHLSISRLFAEKYKHIVPESDHQKIFSALWLHDVIEDCPVTYNDLVKEFETEIAEIVYALTNEKGRNRKERAGESYYRGLMNFPSAKFVKMCDRLANMHYSHLNGSKMIEVYRKELPQFLGSILNHSDVILYKEMIAEMYSLLNQSVAIPDNITNNLDLQVGDHIHITGDLPEFRIKQKLKTLEENDKKFEIKFVDANKPILNGIECPKCGCELYDFFPLIVLTSIPPKKNIGCLNKACGYTGFRNDFAINIMIKPPTF